MTLRIPFSPPFVKGLLLLVFALASPAAFALSDFVRTQSPQHITALIYGLLGLMAILFVTPFLQFYLGAARESEYKEALAEQARSRKDNKSGDIADDNESREMMKDEPLPDQHKTVVSQAQLHQWFEASPVGMGKLNSEHQIISANPDFIRRFGYTESELRQGNVYKLFADTADAGHCQQAIQNHNGVSQRHVELVSKDGERFPTELTVMPADDSCEEYFFWTVNYSDEQFQYDKFNALLENCGLPIAILTEQGFSKLNKLAYKFFNLPDDAAIRALYPHSPALNPSQEKADELAALIETARNKGGVISIPWTHNISGDFIPCELTLVPVYKYHRLDSLLCLWTDLRQLHQAGEALKQATAALDAMRQSQAHLPENQQPATEARSGDDAQALADAHTKLRLQEEELTARDKEIAAITREREARERETSAWLSQIDALKRTLNEKEQKLALLDYQVERLEAEQENATDFIRQLTVQLNAQRKHPGTSGQPSPGPEFSASDTSAQFQATPAQSTSESFQENQALLEAKGKVDAELISTKAALTKARQKVNELDALCQQMKEDATQQSNLIDDLMEQLATLKRDAKQSLTDGQADTPKRGQAPSQSAILHTRPDIESIRLPTQPVSWFDLNNFWANQPSDFRLSLSLSALLDEIDELLRQGDAAVQSEKMAEISAIAQHLLRVSKTVNAEQLIDLAKSFTSDCRLGMKDNALVRWQPTKQALQKSQRVVYEQLQHV